MTDASALPFPTVERRSAAVPPASTDLRNLRLSGFLVTDVRGRFVGRVDNPVSGASSDTLSVRLGLFSRRRCTVPTDSIELIDERAGVVGLRVDRETIRPRVGAGLAVVPLVTRVASRPTAQFVAYLSILAAALTRVLEREALYERNVERESERVAASERRLIRLGLDLHDGPLQDLVAFAEDIRLARAQMSMLIGDADWQLVDGRFADLEARLESLDRGLREIARSVRSTTPLAGPLEDALRAELDALARVSGIATSLSLEGNLDDLTDSQRVVVLRVVQESLANVRKHSAATTASVNIRSTHRFLDVAVVDNGRGFERPTADRLGLAGISERVRLLGGTTEIDGHTGRGTKVRITLPRWQPRAGSPTPPPYAAAHDLVLQWRP